MPTLRTPLVGSYNQRSFVTPSGKDQFNKATILTKIVNKQSNSASFYVEKRPGVVAVTVSAGNVGQTAYYSPSGTFYVAIYGATTGEVWWRGGFIPANVDCGGFSTNYLPQGHMIEVILGGVTFVLISATNGTNSEGYYLASDSVAQITYTGKTTAASVQMDGITAGTGTAGMYSGQLLVSANLGAGTRVSSVISTTQITVTPAASGTGTAAFTKTPLAKIISVNFPTNCVGSFAELDGYIFIMTADSKIYNSDLNSITSWQASNFLTAGLYSDKGLTLSRVKNQIAAFSTASFEFFYNAGNPSGSPLSPSQQLGKNASNFAAKTSASVSQTINDTVFWFGLDNNLYAFDGFSSKKITSAGIVPQIYAYTYLSAFSINGLVFINLSSGTPLSSIWYCVDADSFHESSLFGNSSYAFCQSDGNSSSAGFISKSTGGKLYNMYDIGGNAVFQDDAVAYTMSIQIATDMGTNFRKFVNELRIEADVQSSGSLAVSYSDDDGVTFSTARNISLTNTRMRLPRLGSFVGSRLWKFEHNANTPCRLKTLELEYSVGKR